VSNCDKVLHHIYEYLNTHDVTDALSDEIREHLEKCRHCYDRVTFEKRLLERLRRAGGAPCPETLKKRIETLVKNF